MRGRLLEFESFDQILEGARIARVEKVTPNDGYYIHRFFDTSPWSPSGRYLAVLRLPFQDREPRPDDEAMVEVIDLENRIIRDVGTTRAWCTQMGAQQQWGVDDRFLYFNDIVNGEAVGVRFDLDAEEAFFTEGPLYQVSRDGRFALGVDLFDVNKSQAGYGAAVPADRSPGFERGTGGRALWRTDLETGKRECLVSFDELVKVLPDAKRFKRCAFVGFHVKFNALNDRVLFVLRAVETKARHGRFKRYPNLLTLKPDGTDVTVALPYSEWKKGGHHPNWHPDSRRCLMNLKLDEENMRFVEFRYDGTGLRPLFDDIPGSGHPSYSHDGQLLVTDAYLSDEHVPCRDGAVALRLIDVSQANCTVAAWIPISEAGRGALRCDPHPAWNADGTQVCFNGAPGGRRQVFVAHLRQTSARSGGEVE